MPTLLGKEFMDRGSINCTLETNYQLSCKGQLTCLSLAGFQSGSKRTSLFPPTKLRPHPPALLLKRNANSSWKDTLIQPESRNIWPWFSFYWQDTKTLFKWKYRRGQQVGKTPKTRRYYNYYIVISNLKKSLK